MKDILTVSSSPHLHCGMNTRDIMRDVIIALVPALIASVCIGEIFAAGEVAFIMQLGGLLEELTVAKARATRSRPARSISLARLPCARQRSEFSGIN